MNTLPSPAEVRALRDAVFGVLIGDDGWTACRANWSRPDSVEWLLEHASRPPHLPLTDPKSLRAD